MVIRISGTQPQGPKHLETLENKTVDGTQNTVRVNRGTSANRPVGAIIGDLYYNTEIKDLPVDSYYFFLDIHIQFNQILDPIQLLHLQVQYLYLEQIYKLELLIHLE